MRPLIFSFLLLSVLFSSCKKEGELHMVSKPEGKGIELAEEFGFHLSMQSSTFMDNSLVAAFERTEKLGIKNIEIALGHPMGEQWANKPFDISLTIKEQEELKTLADHHHLRIVGAGVFTTKEESDWQKIFSFAQSMEMEYILCEPEYEHLNLIANLADQTGIKVGIHNSLAPSNYWDPSMLRSRIGNHSKNIGACADVGNWARERLDQIECLEYLDGKIHSLHFKDIVIGRGRSNIDNKHSGIIWGLGILDTDAILIELKRQKFKGYLTIEYDNLTPNIVNDLEESLGYYDIVCYQLFNETDK